MMTNHTAGRGMGDNCERRFEMSLDAACEEERVCKSPNLVQRPARPHRYTAVSTDIMAALDVVTPNIEMFSVDEALSDVTDRDDIHSTPERVGHARLCQFRDPDPLSRHLTNFAQCRLVSLAVVRWPLESDIL